MDQTTTSTQADDGSTGTADKPGTAHRTRRRAFLAMGAAAILAAGAGAGAFASRSGPFAAKAKPTTSTFSGATDTVTKGDLQGQTSVSGTLRYSDSRKFKSGFEGVLIQVPASGAVLTQGDVLYRTGNETAYLMRGNLPAWRSFEAVPRTGTLPLGRIVFTPGDLRVGTVTARVGDRVAADTELFDVTSTTQVVDANIKLSDQKLAGKITSVGTPTEKSSGSGSGAGSGSGESKERVIPITVTLTDASATTNFQEVSVTVDLPSEKRTGVLSVPVGALLALSADQYGVEIVEAGGTTRKVPVTIGLFAGGRVEISGQDISEGQRVVVPQT